MLNINNFVSTIEIQVYYIQQVIYPFLSSELDNTKIYTFIFLFISGLLTSLNPCFISITPIIISYINDNQQKYIFIIGLFSSMVSIISLSLVINTYNRRLLNIPIFTSGLIIIIGLNLLEILNFNLLQVSLLNVKTNISNFLIGFIFGLSSFSCSTPVITGILLKIYNNGNIFLEIIYLLCYILGYIMSVIILLETAINYSKIKVISQMWNSIMPISGSFILGMGIFSFLEYIFIN
uniref:Cytochrome c biogenesis protein transmembrane region n=1 Tax=Mastocarpus papillatus TaxID=31436 RepID=A0A342RZA8_9FLOR|nr:cytochrome c biogenesis protein transmembrane region [Mastocarpus papillatus]AOL58054.1 cytochrome c biogenesis protein transmembrane region [Mastocarpus papillatus]